MSSGDKGRNVLTSTIGGGAGPEGSAPVDRNERDQYPRPSLPPPLPPVMRGGSETPKQHPREGHNPGASSSRIGAPGSAQQPLRSMSPEMQASSNRRPPASPQAHRNSASASGVLRPGSAALSPSSNPNTQNHTTASTNHPHQQMVGSGNAGPRTQLMMTPSKRARSQSRRSSMSSSTCGRGGEEGVEELMPLPLTRKQPVEKFFVEYTEHPINVGAAASDDAPQQPRNEEEMLLEQFAEYTNDDSFFSSGSTVIECDLKRLETDPLRDRAIISVHETLELRSLAGWNLDQYQSGGGRSNDWLFQIHNRALALEHSSFFIFPARWMPRVVVYNILHHWMFELLLFFIILGYAIFEASWARYTSPHNELKRPDFMLWADVFYTVLLSFELIARLFASGFFFHSRAFFRSPWHWLDTAVLVLMIMACTWWRYLWNFTSWRLIRCIKCLTYVPLPLRMKLLAKSLLRSTNRVIQVSVVLLYFIFFFGLLGLQLFSGSLHNRCVNEITGAVTDQVCRTVSTGQYWFYWGHHCDAGYTCVASIFPNPHYDFRSFDDIGHAMLSVFQIMTFQGWTGLMIETNDCVAVLAFLYYAFTILLCAWVVPSLYLGVFIEKIERTSRLFVLKQLDLFDKILMEQRQRMSALVRISDFVERDEQGRVPHYPAYDAKRLDDDTSNSQTVAGGGAAGGNRKPVSRTQWTDEQRVQLHLSLTRQRDVAEEAERKRLDMHGGKLADQLAGAESGLSRRPSTAASAVSSRRAASTAGGNTENFALGGRVGTVQHHQATPTIGASRQSELPFAVRQEAAAESLRFLDAHQSAAHHGRPASAGGVPGASGGSAVFGNSAAGGLNGSETANSYLASLSRPPLGPGGVGVVATRESVGVMPNRAAMSARGSMLHLGSSRVASSSGLGVMHASSMHSPMEREQVELVVNDPEGGDFDYADTCMQKIDIIRNICHMFTEGYPRILTQYLWEHRMMQYRYGLTPLSYSNKYEEEALQKLRQRRTKEREEEREEMRRHGQVVHDDDNDSDAKEADGKVETSWMREEGLVAGSMSPIRMARNIKENAPITFFNYIMYFFIIANAIFNASRFDTMPDYWEMGTFVAGVCFSVLFMLELLVRFLALGPGPFFFDLFNVIDATFMVISLFQLGFSRANTISLFNWVRFLRLFRVIPVRPLRRVSRVLIHAFPDMVYALVFFTLYMFMWLLIGMSFFGNRIGWIDYSTSDYTTRGNFETFSHAAYAVAQAFSVNRDQWLLLSWSGMRVRGGYTVMYFIATVLVAFVLRFFLIAVMTYAWQAQEEREDYMYMTRGGKGQVRRAVRLPWFDFGVWRSFKHIHGGFERRDVAPDEVYFLNEDMRRQLRIAEAKERYYKENYERQQLAEYGGDVDDNEITPDGPKFINWGGQLHRQPSAAGDDSELDEPAQRVPLFSRAYRRLPAHVLNEATHSHQRQQQPQLLEHSITGAGSIAPSDRSRSVVNPLIGNRHSLSPARAVTVTGGAESVVAVSAICGGAGGGSQMGQSNASVAAAQLLRLGYNKSGSQHNISGATDGVGANTLGDGDEQRVRPAGVPASVDDDSYEHTLVNGPRYRYKSIYDGGYQVFERCLDCNTYKQMPLRASPLVAQRTADDLHAEHCHMAAVRSSRQLVLKALIGFVKLQVDHDVLPTSRVVETVLGQAWSCGMLLFETIENLSCADLSEPYRTWDRMMEALEVQRWLLALHVGEEQVGRATLAYILAHQQKQETVAHEEHYAESWQDHTFFVMSPSNPVRRGIASIVESWWFEAFILLIIFGSSVCLACYTPNDGNRDMGGSHNSGKYKALHILDDIFAVIFTVEMVLKWICMGIILPVKRAYFWHLWNIFDCFIVVISLVSWGDTHIFLRYLKVMRCFRILGPLRFCKWNKSMQHVAMAMWDSIPTLANVCLLMLMNYIVWAIIFVSMFMNKTNYCSNATIVNATECVEGGFSWYPAQRNFRNFYESLLTTVELSTGAEWMDVMYSATDSWSARFSPITNRHPYLGLVFIAYYYLSHFVLFSLFISAMIYCYLLAKNAWEGAAGVSFEHQLWVRMQGMITDLKPKVRLLPMNNALSRGIHVLISNKWFEALMGLILTFNMITMALYWRGMSNKQTNTLDIFQYVFVGIFTVEVILRLIAHGPRFFTRWAYCWDLLVMCLSYIQIGLNTTDTHGIPFNVNVLRVLRMGRFLSLVDLVIPFKTYLSLFNHVIRMSIPGIINVSLVYMLAVYVFAILGLHFLGYIVPFGGYIDGKYNNFQTFVNALIMVFRLSTLENWVAMLRGSLDRGNYCARGERCGPTDWAPVYYIPIVICFFLMISTLYMAVILDHYVAAIRMRASVIRLHELRRFSAIWTRHDPNRTMLLPTRLLPSILEELRLPLGLSSRHNRIELLQMLREYDIPDHDGRVYYYEVLIPLARRVMAMAFHENEDTAEERHDLAWRLSERSLGALPVSKMYPGTSTTTVAEHFAASYVQAAYRRDRAMRNLYIMKSDQWRNGRAACDAKGLNYESFGFGTIGLSYEDPREGAGRVGFYVPEEATMASTAGPIYANNVRAAQLQADREAAQRAKDGPATILPAMYRSAIQETEPRFGPNAPDAIKRHERRSDKLNRKRQQEEQERQQHYSRQHQADGGTPAPHDDSDHHYDSGEEAFPHDSPVNPHRDPTSTSVGGSRLGASVPALRQTSRYNTDVDDVNYQPPLGSDPQEMRTAELQRRQASTAANRIPPSSHENGRSPSR